MVQEGKPDFPPLLSAGLHTHTMDELEKVTIAPFGGPGLERRIELFASLKFWVEKLAALNIHAEVWLDGSFMTYCPMPKDVDLVVVAPEVAINALPDDARNTLSQLLDNRFCKLAYNLDVYFVTKEDLHNKAYWRGLFGFCRDEITPKGIALIKMTT